MKLIVTDCDGVLLNWRYSFELWMTDKGYHIKDEYSLDDFDILDQYDLHESMLDYLVGKFCQSSMCGSLLPYRDAVYYVRKFVNDGYKFDVISNLGPDHYSYELRVRNLEMLFGADAFYRIRSKFDIGNNKKDQLQEHLNSGYLWLEDNPKWAAVGKQLGMRSVVFDHEYNQSWDGERVNNWEELYNLVTGE